VFGEQLRSEQLNTKLEPLDRGSVGCCLRAKTESVFSMLKFLSPNLERTGRIVRAVLGSLCLVGGVAVGFWNLWAGLALIGSGAFMLFEALRGWCVMRACGIKTRY
jgi:hypothetical protein